VVEEDPTAKNEKTNAVKSSRGRNRKEKKELQPSRNESVQKEGTGNPVMTMGNDNKVRSEREAGRKPSHPSENKKAM